jgi:hypothetical protein
MSRTRRASSETRETDRKAPLTSQEARESADSTVICADELGPVIPRTFPPAPGWSPDGHRVKAPLEYSRGLGYSRYRFRAYRCRSASPSRCWRGVDLGVHNMQYAIAPPLL